MRKEIGRIAALITTLHRLRKGIGNERMISLKEGKISLNKRDCWLDVWAVEHLCEKAASLQLENGTGKNAIKEIGMKLVNRYGGPFLHDQENPSWARPLRTKLRDKFTGAITRMAHWLMKANEYEDAIALCLRGLEVDALSEALYRTPHDVLPCNGKNCGRVFYLRALPRNAGKRSWNRSIAPNRICTEKVIAEGVDPNAPNRPILIVSTKSRANARFFVLTQPVFESYDFLHPANGKRRRCEAPSAYAHICAPAHMCAKIPFQFGLPPPHQTITN